MPLPIPRAPPVTMAIVSRNSIRGSPLKQDKKRQMSAFSGGHCHVVHLGALVALSRRHLHTPCKHACGSPLAMGLASTGGRLAQPMPQWAPSGQRPASEAADPLAE